MNHANEALIKLISMKLDEYQDYQLDLAEFYQYVESHFYKCDERLSIEEKLNYLISKFIIFDHLDLFIDIESPVIDKLITLCSKYKFQLEEEQLSILLSIKKTYEEIDLLYHNKRKVNNGNLKKIFKLYEVLNGLRKDDDLEEYDNYEESNDPVIEDGHRMYLNEIKKIPIFTAGEELEAFLEYQNIVEAEAKRTQRNYIAEHYLRYVERLAHQFVASGVPLEDLSAYGCIGLINAIEKFNPHLGYRFSTYATYHIKASIRRSIQDTKRTIRIPVYIDDDCSKLKMQMNDLANKLGHYPEPKEVAEYLNRDINEVNQLLYYMDDNMTSLNKQLTDEEDSSELEEFIPDMRIDVSNEASLYLFEEAYNKACKVSKLTPRQQDVLDMYYGYNGYERHILEEIKDKYHVTRERIRQIKLGAEKKLDNPKAKQYLIDYYGDTPTKDPEIRKYRDYFPKDESLYTFFPDESKKMVNSAVRKLEIKQFRLVKRLFQVNFDLEEPEYAFDRCQVRNLKEYKILYDEIIPNIKNNLEIIKTMGKQKEDTVNKNLTKTLKFAKKM